MKNPNVTAEIIALVKNGTIKPLYNEHDQLIGLNYITKSTGTKLSRMIDGHMCVGNTEEELEQDIAAYRSFAEKVQGLNVKEMLELAMILNKPEMTAEDTQRLAQALQSDPKVEVREVNVGSTAKYGNLANDLEIYDNDELRKIMNKARRENARDLFNASRKILRHRGVNC